MSPVHNALFALLFLSGSSFLFFLATAAMLRLPDVYTRMNVLTKAVALGMAGIAGALLIQTPGLAQSGKIISVWLVIYYTGRVARRRLVRTAASRSVPPWEL